MKTNMNEDVVDACHNSKIVKGLHGVWLKTNTSWWVCIHVHTPGKIVVNNYWVDCEVGLLNTNLTDTKEFKGKIIIEN